MICGERFKTLLEKKDPETDNIKTDAEIKPNFQYFERFFRYLLILVDLQILHTLDNFLYSSCGITSSALN